MHTLTIKLISKLKKFQLSLSVNVWNLFMFWYSGKMPHIAYKGLWMSSPLKYFSVRNWCSSSRSLCCSLGGKNINKSLLLPPLENNWALLLYVPILPPPFPGAPFLPRKYLRLLLSSLHSECCHSLKTTLFCPHGKLHNALKTTFH